ncbi:hypothetical protein PIB30_010998 [Stylosanthes scabra]|uniref:Uncharacterized protein n=1 Tax=Stylosanthes scabra TaxID=79078 RepID=A0ABU6V402_9FABA|nr:hypothetical protein [Stylosanthes scabra]
MAVEGYLTYGNNRVKLFVGEFIDVSGSVEAVVSSVECGGRGKEQRATTAFSGFAINLAFPSTDSACLVAVVKGDVAESELQDGEQEMTSRAMSIQTRRNRSNPVKTVQTEPHGSHEHPCSDPVSAGPPNTSATHLHDFFKKCAQEGWNPPPFG